MFPSNRQLAMKPEYRFFLRLSIRALPIIIVAVLIVLCFILPILRMMKQH